MRNRAACQRHFKRMTLSLNPQKSENECSHRVMNIFCTKITLQFCQLARNSFIFFVKICSDI